MSTLNELNRRIFVCPNPVRSVCMVYVIRMYKVPREKNTATAPLIYVDSRMFCQKQYYSI